MRLLSNYITVFTHEGYDHLEINYVDIRISIYELGMVCIKNNSEFHTYHSLIQSYSRNISYNYYTSKYCLVIKKPKFIRLVAAEGSLQFASSMSQEEFSWRYLCNKGK